VTSSTRAHPALGTTACGQAGLTLIELLIAMTLGLLLLFAIGTVYVTSTHTARVQDDYARLQEAGRTALEMVGRGIRQAGYADVFTDPRKTGFTGTALATLNTTCPTASPVSDVVTVQFDASGAGEQDCQAVATTAGDFVQQSYYVTPDATTGIPSLHCRAVTATPPTAPTVPATCPAGGSALLENVEDLQVLYGEDTNADGNVDQYRATPSNAGNVLAVKVCVLVRSQNTGLAPGGQRFLTCNGALAEDTNTANDFVAANTAPANDTRLRRAFVATFSLRNRIRTNP
jgi:type IV pilus assembly protein PilW